jgi:predicted GH43/DUF377 family glycosyl hydrolase
MMFKKNLVLSPIKELEWARKAIFNPAVIYHQKKFHMLFRAVGEYSRYVSRFGYANSTDGIHFTLKKTPHIVPNREEYDEFSIEDPSVVELEGNLYLTYASMSQYYGAPATVRKREGIPDPPERSIVRTYLALLKDDFTISVRLGPITPKHVHDRDAVQFPAKIGKGYAILHRPKGWGDKPSIYIAFSKYIQGPYVNHRLVMKPEFDWEEKKIGCLCPPLHTEEGWLLFYHGVDFSHTYKIGVALLDKEFCTVKARSPEPVIQPEEEYEKIGDVPNVTVPTASVISNNMVFLYYGAADKRIVVATCDLGELLDLLLSEYAQKE